MTAVEFKEKYPQYSHLEGDELWDKMTDCFMEKGEVYVADPDREIFYLEPTTLNNGTEVFIEDETKTVWINSKGEKGLLKPKFPSGSGSESYKMVIWDTSKLE